MDNSYISYRILPDINLIIAKVVGTISFTEMRDHLFTLIKDKNCKPGMNSFYDLTKCINIDGDLNVLSDFSTKLNENRFSTQKSQTAVLIPSENEKLCRLVKGIILMTSESIVEHRYFYQPDVFDMLRFLELKPEHLKKLGVKHFH